MTTEIYKAIGHHGTSKESGHKIEDEESFIIGTKPDLWLGDGAYFFKEDVRMAKEWSISDGYKKEYNEYSIIEAEIIAEPSTVFDLNTQDCRDIFHFQREQARERFKRSRFKGILKTDVFDGKIINDICSLIPYKVVQQDMFVQLSQDRIKKLQSRVANCTVISVRDPDYCIKIPKIIEEGVL